MTASTTRRTLVLDACMAITFGSVGRLDLITALKQARVVIAARAAEEVLSPAARSALQAALSSEQIHRASIDLSVPDEQESLARFDTVPAFRARGDAEVLALAVCRGLLVGSDDVAVRRHARREVGSGRLVSTLDVLVLAVRQERLTSAAAERLLDRLDIGPAYRRRLGDEGKVLRDLV